MNAGRNLSPPAGGKRIHDNDGMGPVSMNCNEIRPQLELHVLGGLDAMTDALVSAHLESCPRCRREAEQCRDALDQYRASAAADVHPAFAARLGHVLAAELRAEHRRRRGPTALRVLLRCGAIAAAALIAMAVWWAANPRDGRDGEPASGRLVAEAWRVDGASSVPASLADGVVVRGERLYFLRGGGNGPRRIAAVDLTGGEGLWESAAAATGYLAADDQRVYGLRELGGGEIALIAVSAETGREIWAAAEPRAGRLLNPCPPTPLPGGRVARVSGRTIRVRDAATGRTLWRHDVPGDGPLSCVAPADGHLLAASREALYCFDAAAGRVRWSQPLGSPSEARGRPLLALAGGAAYVACPRAGDAASLLAMDMASRRILWRRNSRDVRHILATESTVCTRGADVRAYHAGSGRALWRQPAAGCSPMTVHAGLLYVVDASHGGRLLALDHRSGTEAWTRTGLRSCDAFRRVGGTGLLKTADGVIHAFAMFTP